MYRIISIILLTLFLNQKGVSLQKDTIIADTVATQNSINKKRFIPLISAEIATYSVTMVGLNSLWYKDYAKTPFHFFNDSKEWNQMDKCGHFFYSYYLSYITTTGFKWTGMTSKQSAIWGSALGLFYISSIEIFDGYSEAWGASPTDFLANTIGASFFMTQQLLWNEARIIPKYSFTKSIYSDYRPDLLGKDLVEQLNKDYNAQTCWLSFNLQSLFKSKTIPKWFNIAIGYGADGMTGGHENATEYNGVAIPEFKRIRQFYISPDIDFSKIKTKSKFINTTLKVINFIKVPLPTLEYNSNNKLKLHALYF